MSTTIATGSGFVSTQWQKYDGSDFVNVSNGDTQNYIFDLINGLNQFRNIAVGNSGINYISNVLNYNKLVTPTLISVVKLNSNVGRFVWNNNNIDYGVNGTSVFQLSTDNGLNWQNFYTANAGAVNSDNTIDISSPILSTVANNTVVKFRILNSGNALTDIPSNVVEFIWTKTAKITIPLDSVIKDTNGNCSYQLIIEDAPFSGFVITQTQKITNVRRISGSFSNGENINSSSLDITTRVKSIIINPGIYNINIKCTIISENEGEYSEGIAVESYSFTPDLNDSIVYQNAVHIIN